MGLRVVFYKSGAPFGSGGVEAFVGGIFGTILVFFGSEVSLTQEPGAVDWLAGVVSGRSNLSGQIKLDQLTRRWPRELTISPKNVHRTVKEEEEGRGSR